MFILLQSNKRAATRKNCTFGVCKVLHTHTHPIVLPLPRPPLLLLNFLNFFSPNQEPQTNFKVSFNKNIY